MAASAAASIVFGGELLSAQFFFRFGCVHWQQSNAAQKDARVFAGVASAERNLTAALALAYTGAQRLNAT